MSRGVAAGARMPYHCEVSKLPVAHLGHRGNVGQHRQALRGADRDGAQLAALHVRQQRRHAGRAGLRATGQQVGQLGTGATIRDVGHEGPGDHLQVLHRQVAGTGVAGRPVVDLAGVAPDVRDELLEVPRRHVGMDDEHVRNARQHRHRDEVPVHVVGQVVEDVRVHGQRAHMTQDQRVPVGRGLGHLGHRWNSGTAALVVDEHRLAELPAQLLRHGARDDLARAAGGEGHDEADRPGRPAGLREGRTGQGQRRGGEDGSAMDGGHGGTPEVGGRIGTVGSAGRADRLHDAGDAAGPAVDREAYAPGSVDDTCDDARPRRFTLPKRS
jgi:hypothetical protein